MGLPSGLLAGVDVKALSSFAKMSTDAVSGCIETLRKVELPKVGLGTAILSRSHPDVRLRKLGSVGES
jgi:hypothetical protein